MTTQPSETAGELCLMLRAEDGATYAIPQAALEGHRLSDQQRTELEAQINATGADVKGFYYGPSGNVGSFAPTRPGVVVAFQNWSFVYVTRQAPWQPTEFRPVVR